jgi:hypothetical protein
MEKTISEHMMAIVDSHNANVDGFKLFCGKLDEVSGGGFPPDKWFKLFQITPPFVRHAAEIVRLARAAGINAKYDAQSGSIKMYEQDDETTTKKKTVTYDVVGYDGYEWAVLHRYRNNQEGYVLGIKIPFTGSPTTEPMAWEKLMFKPDGEEEKQ